MPLDVTIELRFDRFLLPHTATRQSAQLTTGVAGVVPRYYEQIAPIYDPFERVVRYVLPPGIELDAHVLYTLTLPVASADDEFGFRAFDGAPLLGEGPDGEEPVRISFLTGTSASGAEPAEPPVPSCEDTFCLAFGGEEPGCELPLSGGCAAGGCHDDASGEAAMGLELASVEGFARTARARVAHGAETGPTTGAAAAASSRFGMAMPLVDPFRPENSYLVYKLLVAPQAYLPNDEAEDPCSGSRYVAPLDPELCLSPGPAEIERLYDWFVQGEAMPLVEPSFVRRREVRTLQDFIAAGASCP